MRRLLLALILTFPIYADCPCIPRENIWVVKTCGTFDCAVTSLTTGGGGPLTFVLPLGLEDPRWAVVQRVVGGSYVEDGTDPYRVETFKLMSDASDRINAITADYHPLIVTAPDGAFLILSLRTPIQPRRHVTAP